MERSDNLGDNVPQPLYVQIREDLRAKLKSGVYKPHDCLPSESKMIELYGVSRITIRQALRDLSTEGLVFSLPGKGNFVSRPKAVQNMQRLEGFSEAMSLNGFDTSSRVISTKFFKAPEEITRALGIPSMSTVYEVKRVRFLNHLPVSVDVSYFPEVIGFELAKLDLSVDIFPLLENELSIPLGAADLSLDAKFSNRVISELLEITEGSPILHVERLSFDQNNRPLDFEYLFVNPEVMKYRFRIERS
jgi:GntR family transcriptional regulator